MLNKETWAERAERLLEEAQAKETLKGGVQNRLRWEDWETLLPEMIEFAKGEIRRRKWRGSRSGVLPKGYDANSVASEVVMRALQGKARLAPGWTRQRLLKELKRRTSNEVRRLHKLVETRAMRSEWDVLRPRESGALQSVLAGIKAGSSAGIGWDDGQVRDKVRKETESRIAEALRGREAQASSFKPQTSGKLEISSMNEIRRPREGRKGSDQAVEKLFECLRAGVVKRREIAARLGMSVTEVTNCRKRLDRTLDELERAGCAGWVIEEWKRK